MAKAGNLRTCSTLLGSGNILVTSTTPPPLSRTSRGLTSRPTTRSVVVRVARSARMAKQGKTESFTTWSFCTARRYRWKTPVVAQPNLMPRKIND